MMNDECPTQFRVPSSAFRVSSAEVPHSGAAIGCCTKVVAAGNEKVICPPLTEFEELAAHGGGLCRAGEAARLLCGVVPSAVVDFTCGRVLRVRRRGRSTSSH